MFVRPTSDTVLEPTPNLLMFSGRSLFRRCLLLSFSLSFLLTGIHLANDRAISQQIDQLVERNYRRHGIKPNSQVTDELFVRRAYLDINGRIPTAAEAQQYLKADSPSRGKLIRYLLNSEGYVSHAYNFWADILRVKL